MLAGYQHSTVPRRRIYDPESGPVCFSLFAAALVCWTARVWPVTFIPQGAARAGTAVLAAVFTVRAIGDRKYVGFFKQVRDTEFARLDSRIYSPLCLLLGLGAAAVVLF